MAIIDRVAGAPAPAGPHSSSLDPYDVPRRLDRHGVDDLLSALGAAIGSFALVYLFYYEVLPLSGVVGFVVCWYVGFLAAYAGVTALEHPRAVVVDRTVGAVVCLAAALVLFAVASVVVYTVAKGHSAVTHLNFFSDAGEKVTYDSSLGVGGIKHAIVGSLIQLAIATAVSLPLGLLTAVFMTEIGGTFTRVVRTVVEAMTAVPDLLAGLFVYTVLVLPHKTPLLDRIHLDKVGLAAAIALSVTMVPIIARSGEVALRIVPGSLREASLALGASQWKTVRMVVIPTARPQLATALILALARAVGESAPLLIVSGESSFFNANPVKNPMNSLPLYIINGVRSGQPLLEARAFGAAVVLLAIVLALFVTARRLSRPRTTRG